MNVLDFTEIAGSVMILAAFAAAQKRKLDVSSTIYLGMNVAGSAALAVVAFLDHSWGFLLLEGIWAVVSAVSLVGIVLRGRAARAGPQQG